MATVVSALEPPRDATDAGHAGASSRADAFDRYVMPELEVLYRVALSITRRKPDAEDLVQDTLLRAYRAIDSFDGRHPRAWLLTIMRNAQVNRTRRRRPELLRDQEAAHEQLASGSSSEIEPEAAVVDSQFDAAVVEALDELPQKFRDVVDMVDINDLSYQEAADALGVPIGTVMSRLHRARARLRKRLAKSGIAPKKPPEARPDSAEEGGDRT